MDEELRKKIEAVLFSVGKEISIDDISRLTKEKDKGKLVACLIELKKKYNNDANNSLVILQHGERWKLTIKDQYIDVAKELGVETELSKTVMETLAVIAYKNPVLQSDVIKVRTNKAYDHLKELEELGYIQRERWGRSKKIRLTQKFFDYFDLPADQLKERFKNIDEMEASIAQKEKQILEIREAKAQQLEEQKREERALEKRNVFLEGLEGSNIKEVIEEQPGGLEVIKEEQLNGMTVVDTEPEKAENKTESDEDKSPEKVGDFEIYKEPERFIEPGLENNEDEETNEKEVSEQVSEELEPSKQHEEPDIETETPEEVDTTQEEISEIQEKKDTINVEADSIVVNNEKESHEEIETAIQEKEREAERQPQVVEEEKEEHSVSESHTIEDEEKDTSEEPEQSDADKIREAVLESKEELMEQQQEQTEPKKEMKEEELFPMEGIPEKIEEKIDERVDEIMEGKDHTSQADDKEESNKKDDF